MAETKLVVIYPYPADVEAFEKAYVEDHVPLAKEKIKGVTKFVATKMAATIGGERPPFYRMAELYFPSVDALKESASTEGTQEAAAHAVSISSGGPPLFLIAEEETTVF
jgi:uncharacterized protein (TIGR02118 family)